MHGLWTLEDPNKPGLQIWEFAAYRQQAISLYSDQVEIPQEFLSSRRLAWEHPIFEGLPAASYYGYEIKTIQDFRLLIAATGTDGLIIPRNCALTEAFAMWKQFRNLTREFFDNWRRESQPKVSELATKGVDVEWAFYATNPSVFVANDESLVEMVSRYSESNPKCEVLRRW